MKKFLKIAGATLACFFGVTFCYASNNFVIDIDKTLAYGESGIPEPGTTKANPIISVRWRIPTVYLHSAGFHRFLL